MRHAGDEGVHVFKKVIAVTLRGSRMPIVVSSGEQHGNVLERQRHRRGFVQLQLIDRNEDHIANTRGLSITARCGPRTPALSP